MSFRFPLLLIVICCASAVRAESLTQAIARAVDHFPDIRSAGARQAVTQAQRGQARAEFFPALDVTVGEGRESSRNITTRQQDVTLTRHETNVALSQLLYDGGAALGQVRRFGALEEGAALTIVETAENAGLRAGETYVDVLRLREQLRIARENLATHEKTLSDVNALADAGRGRRADVTQADARRALAASAVEQLVGQLRQTEALYTYFTGRPPGELEAPPELAPRIPGALDQAVEQANAVHPAVRSAEKVFEAAQYDRDSARARYGIPRVTFEAGSSHNRDLDGIPGQNRDAFAMLRLRYNLFRGFGDVERVREASARIDDALAQLARARNDVERDVRQAWQTLVSDRTRLPQLEAYARASADVAEAYRLQFQLGQRSLLDVLNAENERFNATANFIAGRAAVSAGELRVLASVGQLLPVLGVPAPAATPLNAGVRPTALEGAPEMKPAATAPPAAAPSGTAAVKPVGDPDSATGSRLMRSGDAASGLGLRLDLDVSPVNPVPTQER